MKIENYLNERKQDLENINEKDAMFLVNNTFQMANFFKSATMAAEQYKRESDINSIERLVYDLQELKEGIKWLLDDNIGKNYNIDLKYLEKKRPSGY